MLKSSYQCKIKQNRKKTKMFNRKKNLKINDINISSLYKPLFLIIYVYFFIKKFQKQIKFQSGFSC